MKGTLHKTESGWQVWYHAKEDLFYGNTGVRILPLIDSDYYEVNRPGQYNDGKEVEFEIFDNREICNCACHKNPDITHFVACCNDGYKTDNLGHVNYYAKLVHNWLTMKEGDITVNFKPMPEFDDPKYPDYPTRAEQLREQAWDVIWKDFRANKNASYSWALLEYLRDNYNPPTKKQN